MKIEHIRLKPDRGRSARRGGAELGWPDHVGGQVAHSWAHFGITLVSVVFDLLLSKFHDFYDRIPFCRRGVLPPHLFSIYLYAQHREKNTYPKKIENM